MAIHIKPEALTERVKIDKNMDIVQKTASTPSSSNRIGTFGVDGRNDIGLIKFNANYFSATKTLQVTKKFSIDGISTTVSFGGHFCLIDGNAFSGYAHFEDDQYNVILTVEIENGYMSPLDIDVVQFNRISKMRFYFEDGGLGMDCPWACDSDYGIGVRSLSDLLRNSDYTVSNFSGGEDIYADYIIVNPKTEQSFNIKVTVYDEMSDVVDCPVHYTSADGYTYEWDGSYSPNGDPSQMYDLYLSWFAPEVMSETQFVLDAGSVPVIHVYTYRETIPIYLPCEGPGSDISVEMDEAGYIFGWICE